MDDIIFQQDNLELQKSKSIFAYLYEKGLEVMKWSS